MWWHGTHSSSLVYGEFQSKSSHHWSQAIFKYYIFLKILTGAEVNGTPHPAVWKPSLYTPLYYLCQKALLGFLYVTLQVNVGGQLFNLLARTLQTYQHRAQSSFGTDSGKVFKCFLSLSISVAIIWTRLWKCILFSSFHWAYVLSPFN